ncbi:MAG TPA: outer membrane beta-barrel protein [Geminicoccaceae bacterium]
MNVRRPIVLVLAAAFAGLGVAAPAAAQEPDPNVTIRERPRPAFDPLGLRAGNFLILPSLDVSEIYDDNIFADAEDETDDFITLISPRIEATSNFIRHRLGLTLGADIARYLDEDDENYEDIFGAVEGRLDIRRSTFLDAAFDVGLFSEDRDDPEDVEADERTEYLRYGGELALNHTFNRLFTRLTGRVAVFDYDDAGGINNDDRDRTDYDALLRLGYIVSPRVNVFTEGRYTIEDRDQDIDDQGFNRDSDGWEVRAGAGVDLTAVLFGEAFVGYRSESFDEPTFEDVDGVSFGIDLTWNPTTLTTLILSGGSDIETTTQAGAAGNFQSVVSLSVDHELLRNLLLGATVGYVRDDFDGIDRVDDTISAGTSLTYLINRYFAVEGSYLYSDRSSDFEFEEYSRNQIRLGISAQL